MGLLVGIVVGIGFLMRRRVICRVLPNEDLPKVYVPEEMPALKLLPPGTDSLIAVQLQPLLGFDQGASSTDIRAALIAKGIPSQLVDSLEKNFGLTWGQLDQLIIAGRLKKGFEPERLVAIIHLQQPIAEEQFAEQIHASRQRDRNTGRTTYQTAGTPAMYWWVSTPQIVVGVLSMDVLKEIPTPPFQGLEHLDGALVESIRTIVPRPSFAWAVLQSEEFGSIVGFAMPFNKGLKEWRDPASSMRSLVVALTPDAGGLRINVISQFKSKSVAESWRSVLRERLKGQSEIEVGGDDASVKVVVPADPATIRQVFGNK